MEKTKTLNYAWELAQEGFLIEVDSCRKSGDLYIRLRRIKEEVRKLLGERCCI